jgi:hypothetical protein
MSARRKEATEQAIYLDRDCVGTVLAEEKGRVVALDPNGNLIGVYPNDSAAMSAVIANARSNGMTAA